MNKFCSALSLAPVSKDDDLLTRLSMDCFPTVEQIVFLPFRFLNKIIRKIPWSEKDHLPPTVVSWSLHASEGQLPFRVFRFTQNIPSSFEFQAADEVYKMQMCVVILRQRMEKAI